MKSINANFDCVCVMFGIEESRQVSSMGKCRLSDGEMSGRHSG